MKQAANCKVCAKTMVIEIDDDYAKLGDPFNLAKLATCNRCYDLRQRRQRIEDAIYKVCIGLIQSGIKPNVEGKPQKPEAAAVEMVLAQLTQDYAHLIADWHNRSGIIWDKEFPRLLMENPKRWGDLLNTYWKTFRQTQVQPKQQEMASA